MNLKKIIILTFFLANYLKAEDIITIENIVTLKKVLKVDDNICVILSYLDDSSDDIDYIDITQQILDKVGDEIVIKVPKAVSELIIEPKIGVIEANEFLKVLCSKNKVVLPNLEISSLMLNDDNIEGQVLNLSLNNKTYSADFDVTILKGDNGVLYCPSFIKVNKGIYFVTEWSITEKDLQQK